VATLVYVGNSDTGDLSVLELASDGRVRPVATVPVPGIGAPVASLPLAVSPDARLLFAASRNAPFLVTTYAIDARRGGLSVVGQGTLPASMAYIATDRRRRYLFGASYDGALVSSSAIGTSGVIGATLDVVATAPGAHAIQADFTNARVLYTSLGGDVLYQRELDAKTGELREIEPGAVKLPRGAGPRHFTFAADGRLVFVLGELDGSIHAYPYDPSTGLARSFTQVVSALPESFPGKPWAADIHLTPDGRLLFASERTSSSLVAFRVDASNGELARAGSYATAAQPRAFAIDPSGRHLLAVGERSHTMIVHAIDASTGALTVVGEHAVGGKPNWVEVVDLASLDRPG
jgi:6-phosphogluconolactonase